MIPTSSIQRSTEGPRLVQDSTMIKTAILFHRFGPYHHARLRSVKRDVEVVGVEMSAVDATYAWDEERRAQSFRQVTLFHDRDVDQEKGGEIIRRVHAALDEIRPDVVAIPGWSDRGALAALGWCLRQGVPIVVMSDSTWHDAPRVWWKEALKSRVVRLCQAGFVGGAPQRDYMTRLGMPRERIFVGYDVVDNDHFQRGTNEARENAPLLRQQLGLPERFFLSSNRFIPKKNLPHLMRAYARYRATADHEPWKLVLMGDGELRGELERLRDELKLGEAVLMPGFKQYQELPAYYGLAGAFVHASTVEQWGLVVNEAMAAGLPVLVSRNCGCAADLVQDGVNGYVFDPLDSDMLTGLLLKVAGMPEGERAAMGDASQRIIAHWNLPAFEQNIVLAVQAAMRVPVRKARIYDRVLLRTLIHIG
jgi:glycosyltransferase involved in cell wall biosynthesis